MVLWVCVPLFAGRDRCDDCYICKGGERLALAHCTYYRLKYAQIMVYGVLGLSTVNRFHSPVHTIINKFAHFCCTFMWTIVDDHHPDIIISAFTAAL